MLRLLAEPPREEPDEVQQSILGTEDRIYTWMSGVATYVFLVVTSVVMTLFVSTAMGHIRDELARAERQLHLANWQVRQLLPVATWESGPPGKVLTTGCTSGMDSQAEIP